MSTPTFAHLDPRVVLPSTTNPRKHFDPAKLQELADSIAASGVHQPVLVRPLPAARVPDTAGMQPRPTHELVSGERRLRASLMAGATTLPAMVRELSDDQVLEIQIVENLQRDDLTALEEAEGYQHLMQHSGLAADQVAAKIGKSRSYVYARLKLLDLAPEPRAALLAGELDASRALLIARIPDTKLQAEATKELATTDYNGDPVYSARSAAQHIQQHYMLRLADARFSLADATLLPEAGACKLCPKRTGANPDLFADVKGADVCTDPPCYRRKEQAHADAQLQAARDSGAEIIEGREARRLMPHGWSTRVEGHLRLDDASDSPTNQPLRKLIGKQMAAAGITPVLVANPHREGELIAVLPAEQVTQLLRAAHHDSEADKLSKAADADAKYAERAAKIDAEDELERAWRWQVLEAAKARLIEPDGIALEAVVPALRYAALHFAGQLRVDECKAIAKLLDLGKIAPREGVEQWARDASNPAAALMLLIAARDVGWHRYQHENGIDCNTGLWLVADALGIDPKAIQRRARSDARAAAMATKAAPADPPHAPAAQASGDGQAAPDGAGPAARRRPNAESGGGDPEPGDATASQPNEARPVLRPGTPAPDGEAAPELAIGQQVRVTDAVTGPHAKYKGKRGTVVAPIGSEAWDVELLMGRKGSGLTQRASFHSSELEAAR